MIFREYSFPVTNHSQRYAFEHGPHSFWRRNVHMGWPAMLVTWDGIWLPQQWHKPENILWRADRTTGLSAVITWSSGSKLIKRPALTGPTVQINRFNETHEPHCRFLPLPTVRGQAGNQ